MKGHKTSSDWLFFMLVIERSGTIKTNLLVNLIFGDKSKHIHKEWKRGSRYIRYDDLIVCDYHLDELK